MVEGRSAGGLVGMVAIVTGGGSRGPGVGNGRAAAILFAREGARVVLVDRIAEWADQAQGMIADEHGEAFVIEADVTRDDDCRRVVEQTVQRYGTINILHNNVGIGGSGTVVDTDEEFWDQVMRVTCILPGPAFTPLVASGGMTLVGPSRAVGEEPRR